MDEKKIVTPRLSIRSIAKSFGKVSVLKSVSIEVNPGEIVAVIGRSGSGKTTLLRCVSLMEELTSGELLLDGVCYSKGSDLLYQPWEVRRQVAMVFQGFNLFPNLRVIENIALPLRKVRGFPKSKAFQLAEAQAGKLRLEDCLFKYPNQVSGGQAQRCALARAMVLEPKVLLLDEVTSALDPESILTVVSALKELKANMSDMSILFNTHLMHFASSFADRVCFLENGAILEDLPSKDFPLHCRHPETQQFVLPYLDAL